MNSSQTVDKSMVLPPAPSITDRLRCALPADSAHYGPTVVAHYYSTDSDYRPTLRITDRLCALPTMFLGASRITGYLYILCLA